MLGVSWTDFVKESCAQDLSILILNDEHEVPMCWSQMNMCDTARADV